MSAIDCVAPLTMKVIKSKPIPLWRRTNEIKKILKKLQECERKWIKKSANSEL